MASSPRAAGPHDLPQALRQERLRRLRDTWARARACSAYYRRALPDIPEQEIDFASLGEVPVSTKETFEQQHADMRTRQGMPPFMVFTGGSTGSPRVIYGTEEIIQRQSQGAEPGTPGASLPLTLSTGGGHHGEVPFAGGARGVLHVPLRSASNYRWAWHLLSSEFAFQGFEPRVSGLMLPLPAVKKLVHFLLEDGCDLSPLALRWVGTFAWYLSGPWRKLISRVLAAPVIDYFGFTEALGVLARECPSCGWYHYGADAIPEVVDVESRRPIETGMGSLLLTTLAPDIQDHVLFRYEPGDLVRIGPYCEAAGESGFRPCGRLSQALYLHIDGRKQPVLPAADVQEIVDLEPLVARTRDIRFAGITESDDDDFPRWRSRVEQREDAAPALSVEVALKASPALFYEAWQALQFKWRAQLLSALPELSGVIDRRQARLQIVPVSPQAIPDSEAIIC